MSHPLDCPFRTDDTAAMWKHIDTAHAHDRRAEALAPFPCEHCRAYCGGTCPGSLDEIEQELRIRDEDNDPFEYLRVEW